MSQVQEDIHIQVTGSITINIDGTPIAKGRPRMAKTGVVYTPLKTRKWENYARLAAQQQMAGKPPMAGALFLSVTAVFPVPESWPKWKRAAADCDRVAHVGKPDGDNVLKAVKDAFNGIAWIDDSQIVTHLMTKVYGRKPGIMAHIRQMEQLIPSNQKTKPEAT